MGKKHFKYRRAHQKGKGQNKPGVNWKKYFQEYQQELRPKGIYMRDVDRDGNCLFRVVADQLEGHEKHYKKYRNLSVDYIIQHKDYFKMFLLEDENIDKYIAHMCEDGSWGGHFELVALSSVLNVKFCVHSKDKEPVIVKSDESKHKGAKIVHLAYHLGEHYSSIRKIGDEGYTPAEPIPIVVPENEEDTDYSEAHSERSEGPGLFYKMSLTFQRAINSVKTYVYKLNMKIKGKCAKRRTKNA